MENYKEFIKNNRLILKSQQRFRSKKQNVLTEEVDKIALTSWQYIHMEQMKK